MDKGKAKIMGLRAKDKMVSSKGMPEKVIKGNTFGKSKPNEMSSGKKGTKLKAKGM